MCSVSTRLPPGRQGGFSPRFSPTCGCPQPPPMTLLSPASAPGATRHALDFDCGCGPLHPRAPPATGGCAGWRPVAGGRPPPPRATRCWPGRPTWWTLWPRVGPPTGAGPPGDALRPTTWTRTYDRPGVGPARPAHREEQQAYCARFVLPAIATVELRRLTRGHFAQILAQAPTASMAAHLRRCLAAVGLARGWCWPARTAAGRALVTAARELPRRRAGPGPLRRAGRHPHLRRRTRSGGGG
jgi:hypothetical protein